MCCNTLFPSRGSRSEQVERFGERLHSYKSNALYDVLVLSTRLHMTVLCTYISTNGLGLHNSFLGGGLFEVSGVTT